MKFLVDAQLPYALSVYINKTGHDAIHTNQLPERDFTKDSTICQVADNENRIVITKDIDFYSSFILSNTPKKLLLISTGNIKNKDLLQLFQANFNLFVEIFTNHSLVELDNKEITIHV